MKPKKHKKQQATQESEFTVDLVETDQTKVPGQRISWKTESSFADYDSADKRRKELGAEGNTTKVRRKYNRQTGEEKFLVRVAQ